MYLARKKIRGRVNFFIRESYKKDKFYLSRDIFDLGFNPGNYIIYPGGNSYYIDLSIEDELDSKGIEIDSDELEEIFWPFLRPDIKRKVEHFCFRGDNKKKDEIKSGAQFHLFDRRRVHFLKYGQMDQDKITRVSTKLFHDLAEKSRDELEHFFYEQERVLKPKEFKSYVFVIFDLQRHFYKSFAKEMPQALDQDEVDRLFIDDICRLNSDEIFWRGFNKKNRELNEFLLKYLFMFFDTEYGKSRLFHDKMYEWMSGKRDFAYPEKKTVTLDEAGKIFGVSGEKLKGMSKRELRKLYRKKAREYHPDKGGDPKLFVKLNDAYNDLLNIRNS